MVTVVRNNQKVEIPLLEHLEEIVETALPGDTVVDLQNKQAAISADNDAATVALAQARADAKAAAITIQNALNAFTYVPDTTTLNNAGALAYIQELGDVINAFKTGKWIDIMKYLRDELAAP